MVVSPPIDFGALRGQLPSDPRPSLRGPLGPSGQTADETTESGGVRMSLSAEGLARSRGDEQELPGSKGTDSDSELTEEEQREVEELTRRDREVRAHEAAHKAAAGSLAKGGASFSYETGPDGRRYAVGGEVSIDASPVGDDPAATARKMERVRMAALAPADPSGQDRQVAARAASDAREARSTAAREAMDKESDRSEAMPGRGEAEEASATGSCPVCGIGSHGPEQHSGEIDFRA